MHPDSTSIMSASLLRPANFLSQLQLYLHSSSLSTDLKAALFDLWVQICSVLETASIAQSTKNLVLILTWHYLILNTTKSGDETVILLFCESCNFILQICNGFVISHVTVMEEHTRSHLTQPSYRLNWFIQTHIA